MTQPASLSRQSHAETVALAVLVLGFGWWAVSMGQTSNWDLRNYHWYNGWAWVTGRGSMDLAAAQAQTWFNPLLPAALYLLLSSVKPWLGTFLLGCLQGLNLLPLHRIALQVLPAVWLERRRWLAVAAALVGASGATQRGELGATFGDNLVSLPLLSAIALLLGMQGSDHRRAPAAGALLGLAVGLKLTAAPIAAGIALAAPLLAAGDGPPWRARLHLLLQVGLASLAVFLLVNGHWMLALYREFGNPLFPMFGGLFGGDFAPPGELRDNRWLPRAALQWLFYPLAWADQPRLVSELWFLDLRVPLLFAALLLLPLWWRRAAAAQPRSGTLAFLLLAVALAYLIWLPLFGYYRYLLVLEMLAPLLIAAALAAAPARLQFVALCTVLVALGLATRPARWGRARSYADTYVQVQLPPQAQTPGALVVLGGGEPLAFMAPSFPAGTRFVRILGNLVGPPLPEWALDRAARARIQAHPGPLLLLAVDMQGVPLREALQRQQLRLVEGSCAGADSNLFRQEARPQLCTLEKITSL